MNDIRISACGLSAWELNFLQATVSIASGTDIAQWRYEPDARQAHVVLASADNRDGAAWLERGGSAAEGTALVVALRDRATINGADGLPALGRPIAYPELIALLRALEGRLRERASAAPAAERGAVANAVPAVAAPPVAAAPAPATAAEPPAALEPLEPGEPAAPAAPIAPAARVAQAEPVVTLAVAETPPAPLAVAQPDDTVPRLRVMTSSVDTVQAVLQRKARRAARFFDDTRLLGLVRRAIDSGHTTEIVHPRFAPLRVNPAEQAYESSIDPCTHPEICRVPAIEFSCRVPGGADAGNGLAAGTSQPLWRLLFCAALHGSEGRLRSGSEPADLLELDGAANFSQFPLTREQQSIVLALAAAPNTLQRLVAQSGADLDAVVDLVNAIDVVGGLQRTRAAADGAAANAAASGAPRGAATGSTTIQRLGAMLRAVLMVQRP